MLARLTPAVIALFAIVGVVPVAAQCSEYQFAICCLTPPPDVRSILCLRLILMLSVIRVEAVMAVSQPIMECVTPPTCIAAILHLP